ncbi:MAG: hypothetical protein MI725_11065 [Pirellulales bacterium]|nr:hypothetical protein [Pirellulales bacterium]
MSRTKKILRYGLFLFLVLFVLAYFAGNYLLDSFSRRAMQTLAQRGQKHGIAISQPDFRQATLAGVRTARWTDLSARLRFPESDSFDADRQFDLQIGALEVWLASGGQVSVTADRVEIESTIPGAGKDEGEVAGVPDEYQRVLIDRLECSLDWELFDPAASLEQSLPLFVELITSGAAPIVVKAEGTLEFVLKGKLTTLRLLVLQSAQGNALALEPADVEKLSELFSEKLTAAEVALVAANPLRAPKLLRIKDDAESTAESAHDKDSAVPQDAYRHVLWSFLLTRKYGAEFAEQVTSAHEQGDTGNTAAERDMDLHNNRIGRHYAAQKLKRRQVLQKVLEDADVIRDANDTNF